MATTTIPGLTETLGALERGDLLIVNDVSESTPAARVKKAEAGPLVDQIGAVARPSPAQQLDLAVNYALVPAGGITDEDIGRRAGGSWRITTPTLWDGLPLHSTGENATEKRGHAYITLAGVVWTLRIAWTTLWYASGTTRHVADAEFNRARAGDTIRLYGWTDNSGANSIAADFLIQAVTRDPLTESYVITMRQIRTGAAITPAHRAPNAGAYPTFGVSLGIRYQQPIQYSDAGPQRLGSPASGTSRTVSRADHVHPLPSLAELGLTTAPEIRRDSALGVSGSVLSAAITGTGNIASALCTDGTTLWAADRVAGVLRAFVLATGVRDSAKDITTGATHPAPYQGAACDGRHIWVGFYGGSLTGIRCYTTAGDRVPGQDITLANPAPWSGLATDGTTLWVVNQSAGNAIIAYRLSDRLRDPDKDISRLGVARLSGVYCIATDGTTMWIGNASTDEIYAANLSTGRIDTAKSIYTVVANPRGMTYENGRLYVVGDATTDGIEAYRFVDVVIRTV